MDMSLSKKKKKSYEGTHELTNKDHTNVTLGEVKTFACLHVKSWGP